MSTTPEYQRLAHDEKDGYDLRKVADASADRQKAVIEENGLWPEWASGRATSYFNIGAQLCTRDGRKVGNGVVFAVRWVPNKILRNMVQVVDVITDVGTQMVLNEAELHELFHWPDWTMHLHTHPGVLRVLAQQEPKG